MSVIRLPPFYEIVHLCAVCEQLPCWIMKSVAESFYWKGNSFSASWEITNILWNLKVLYQVKNIPWLVLILIQMNPVYALHYIWELILLFSQPCLNLPSGPFPSGFSPQPFVFLLFIALLHTSHIPHLCHPPWVDHPSNNGEQYKVWSSSYCSDLHSSVTAFV